MNLQDYVGVAQSCAITVVFLYLSWQLPTLFVRYLAWKTECEASEQAEAQRVREFQRDERELDRKARHDMNTTFHQIVSEMFLKHEQDSDKMVAAITELKIATMNLCQYRRWETGAADERQKAKGSG